MELTKTGPTDPRRRSQATTPERGKSRPSRRPAAAGQAGLVHTRPKPPGMFAASKAETGADKSESVTCFIRNKNRMWRKVVQHTQQTRVHKFVRVQAVIQRHSGDSAGSSQTRLQGLLQQPLPPGLPPSSSSDLSSSGPSLTPAQQGRVGTSAGGLLRFQSWPQATDA